MYGYLLSLDVYSNTMEHDGRLHFLSKFSLRMRHKCKKMLIKEASIRIDFDLIGSYYFIGQIISKSV